MRSFLLAIIAALLVGCATTPDPIDRLVADYSASHGMWVNGTYPILDMPQTASPEQVIKKRFEMGLPRGQVANYKILKIRQIHIPTGQIGSDLYTAALVQTDSGEKIVLLKYDGRDWWSRVEDANRTDIYKK
jgi:type IV pilus biogenesis protein CpaD/CtpE